MFCSHGRSLRDLRTESAFLSTPFEQAKAKKREDAAREIEKDREAKMAEIVAPHI